MSIDDRALVVDKASNVLLVHNLALVAFLILPLI